MACRGTLVSLDADQVAALKSIDEDERVWFVNESFEEDLSSADESRVQGTEKAWDAIHRSLTDGGLARNNGRYPLSHVILGGEWLYRESDYILSLKSPKQVKDIAAALSGITEEKLRAGYERINPDYFEYPIDDHDFEYTWDWFQEIVAFYRRAAFSGHSVLFAVDQ